MRLAIVAAISSAVLTFGMGLFVGRHLPAHHYERFGESRFLLDQETGALCSETVKPNPFDEVFPGQKDSQGFMVVTAAYPPACTR